MRRLAGAADSCRCSQPTLRTASREVSTIGCYMSPTKTSGPSRSPSRSSTYLNVRPIVHQTASREDEPGERAFGSTGSRYLPTPTSSAGAAAGSGPVEGKGCASRAAHRGSSCATRPRSTSTECKPKRRYPVPADGLALRSPFVGAKYALRQRFPRPPIRLRHAAVIDQQDHEHHEQQSQLLPAEAGSLDLEAC